MKECELLVMAAGVGSRFGGLKQVEPVGPAGERLVDYSIFDALRAGVRRVVFVIRRDMEAEFHALVGSRFSGRVDVAYAFQDIGLVPPWFEVPPARGKPWGTAHAILAARGVVRAPFLVINADDFYGAAAYRLGADFLREPAADPRETWAMVGYRLANTLSEHGTVSRGVCEVGADGRLRAIAERTALVPCPGGARDTAPGADGRTLAGDSAVSMNFWAFRLGLFALLEERFERFLRERGHDPKAELYISSVAQELIAEDRATVTVLESPDPWFGMTHREDRAKVAAELRSLAAAGAYPDPLWA